MKKSEQTIADYGRKVAALVPELEDAIQGYLSLSTGGFGTPLERRKQRAIVEAFVLSGLTSFTIKGAADMRKWLKARPASGLIVK